MITLVKLFKHYLLRVLLIAASMLILAAPLAWMQIHYPHQVHSLSLIFSQHSLIFTLFRWALIGLFVGYWPVFIKHQARKHLWNSEKTSFWLAQRYRIAGWLIIFELMVCENLLLLLIKAL